MLVGREPERGIIRGLVAAARVGQSGCLVLTGEAGIGKTALLEDAVETAVGMRVLRATGSESESEVPFGALLQLLRPALVHLDRIPPPQAAALASALALRPGPEGDRFAVGAATLSLLSRYAEDGPVAVLVDDAHLLDLPSAQALTFAARRLTADPIAVLATVRDGPPVPFTTAGLPVLPVGGLSEPATAALLAATGRHPGAAAVARLHGLTGGNPLALVELADHADALDPPFGTPVPVPASLARAFARRVDRLSAPARTAVLVAAAAGGDLAVVTAACRRLGVDVTALDEAADAGLLRLTADGIAFRHSLVRSAVYSDAAPGARRATHRAVAAALPAHETDRRAWHLGEAALGPDEETARTLAAVAAGARGRSAHAVASGAYERAARLSPDAADRVARYLAAGESAWQAGLVERALDLLTQASAAGPALAARTAIAGLRGRIGTRTGSVEQARVLLVAAGTEVAGTDPDTAVLLLADAILACFFLGDIATVAQAATVIDGLVPRATSERARVVGAMAGGLAGVLTGRGGPDRIRPAVHQLDPAAPLAQDPQVATLLVTAALFLRESDTDRELVRSVVDGLRRRAALGGLPYLLFAIARDDATTDRWDRAEPAYAEGIQLARETGHTVDLAGCLAGLSWLEARQGREAECRAHAIEAEELCRPRSIGLFRCWSLYALGELELGLGRPDAAVERFDRLERLLTELGLADVDLSPAPEQVDALIRLGREGEARDTAARYAARAAAKGQPWALARAARAVALTGPDADLDEQIGVAFAYHARTLDAYELARTRLGLGSRLRRLRRRTDARPLLREALATLEALGATPWANQAAAELRATGETAHRRDASAAERLTPQEVQVATMLAAGRTTREAAATLFLSPKTVEYHLRHVYVKLGIRSRAELADALGPARLRG